MEQTIQEKIKQRRLQMLVHSCIYYKFNESIVSDYQWSKWAKELEQLQRDYPKESEETEYYNIFKNWNGSTGCDLPINNDIIINKAKRLMEISKK